MIPGGLVALLAEGVDKNQIQKLLEKDARGVALLAEGVDRNSGLGQTQALGVCRPPRGGRG